MGPMSRNSTPLFPILPVLVGTSPAMQAIREQVRKVADSTASVLVTGPSGTGKDVVAQLLHQQGGRANRPFVALNCAAVASDLLESEMFGHEVGAFTGAVKARAGRFEAASTGTLFLDEVGDMPLAMQAKLLRALETRVVERVGGMLPIAVDVRLVAATSVDLDAAIARGAFRADLLYRLDVIRIEMPALAQRPEDVPALVEHFIARAGGALRFTPAAMDLLMQQAWPGNVRELKNVVDRALVHHGGETLGREALGWLLRPAGKPQASPAARRPAAFATIPHRGDMPVPSNVHGPLLGDAGVDLRRILADVERAYIEAALARSGSVAASAKLLGLQRTTLIEKMRRFRIQTTADVASAA